MAITIGIIYEVDENWIAGSYYIENLVGALGAISGEKPHLKVYSRTQLQVENLRRKTNYPLMSWAPMNDENTFFDKAINKIYWSLSKRHIVTRGIDNDVDILFPASDTYIFDNIKHKLFWIPDFQEVYFPNFFGKKEIERRYEMQKLIVERNRPLIVSSESAKSDFYRLFPRSRNRVFVLPFAVKLPSIKQVSFKSLQQKFGIDRVYFICSNQFWAHKNHIVVLRAISQLKTEGRSPLVLFTGKPHDPRNPEYYDELVRYVKENELVSNALFLGFIDRTEQLVLMKNSTAIIQPSLFEGWSTVIEDAKALGQKIIVSDIPVHREQLSDKYNFYFNKDNAAELADIMKRISEDNNESTQSVSYDDNLARFGEKFMDIINQLV